MTDWFEYIAAFLGFFAAHNIPTRPATKAQLQGLLGKRGFSIGYSVLSLAVLYWLIMAAGRAPVVVLWDWAPWQNHVPFTAMALFCLILCLGVARPNPFSFGGRNNASFDPKRPGLIRYTRHPILLALALWAFAHLVPNGQLAHAILFTVFGLFALMGMRLIDRRKKREMPEWENLQNATRQAPYLHAPLSWGGLVLRLVIAVNLYVGLLHAHGPIVGVYPAG